MFLTSVRLSLALCFALVFAAARKAKLHCGSRRQGRPGGQAAFRQASGCLSTSVAFVPPKPNEFDITWPSWARAALATRRIRLTELNWLGESAPEDLADRPVAVRVRSTREPRPARLSWNADEGCLEVELVVPEDGVSPGQACVIYADDGPRARVLGGGTIRRIGALQAGAAEAA